MIESTRESSHAFDHVTLSLSKGSLSKGATIFR